MFFFSLNFALDVSRNLVAAVLQQTLGLEYHGVSLVELVHFLAFLLICLCIGFSFCLHALDLFLGEAAGGGDGDVLLLAGCLILGADVQDTVGIDIEGYLHLRNAATSRCNTIKVELADALVLACHRTLALQDVDGYGCLVICCGGEDFALLAGDGRVGFDEARHHAAQRLDTH